MVFRISILVVALLSLAAGLWPKGFNVFIQSGLTVVSVRFGWLYLLVVFATLVFLIYLLFSRFANLRIGGEDAEPEFSNASWLSMLFAAGMGIGLVFWGAAEPVSHYIAPPEGLAPQTAVAARASMRYVFFHWGLHPWAIYALVGLAMSWFMFNRQGRGLISDLLQPLIGNRHAGWIGHLVNILAIVATALGVATTLGFGTLQISAGLERVFGIPSGKLTQMAVITIAFVLYMASTTSGVTRGIKWLSNGNLALAVLLLLLVLALGPVSFIFDIFTTTLGAYLSQLVSMSLRMSPFTASTWVQDWTIFYWAWWISWSPFVGIFIARISKGRTVREFVLGVVIAPTLLGFLWFSVFGGAAMWEQMFGNGQMVAAVQSGYQNVLFALLDTYPAATFLAGVTILLLVIFFVTSADSAVLVLATMSSPERGDPPVSRRIIWGVSIAVIAAALLLAGGLDALQSALIITAFPFAILLVLIMWSLYRVLDAEYARQRQLSVRTRQAIERWLQRDSEAAAAIAAASRAQTDQPDPPQG
ncbi:MAG TPA: BCCT family transporter [Burkholderiaceae bacterium]|nr:BCCT family transporter [Burkholderiaceae bacterium]